MDQSIPMSERPDNWLERLLSIRVSVNFETLIFASILVAAVITRFYDLDTRVMSHDESLHTYYSWELSEGRGFTHTPLMHGPLQFHLVGLSYFLFGDSDGTARIPAALAGVAAVAQVFKVEGATHKSSYNIGWLVYGFTFLVLGGPATLFIILIAHFIEWAWHKYPWYIQSFNIATFAVAVTLASWVYNWILGVQVFRDICIPWLLFVLRLYSPF